MHGLLRALVLGAFASVVLDTAAAAKKLTDYCSAQEDWCQLMATAFDLETGIEVAMTRKSSGETYAQLRA